MTHFDLSDKSKIKLDHNQNYYLFLEGKKKEDIFINGNVARLELKKRGKLYDTLNGELGYYQFFSSKKSHRIKITITRYAGESRDYKMIGGKGRAFNSDFGYWEINEVYEPINEYFLETIYYHLKMELEEQIKKEEKDIAINDKCIKEVENDTHYISYSKNKIGQKSKGQDLDKYKRNKEWAEERTRDLKEKLADLYRWELEWENQYWKNNQIYRTNPHHVSDIKEYVKELN